MQVVIIEDEQHTAKDLVTCIRKAEPAAEIIAILSSVKEAAAFFKNAPDPDLIFSDIQLGDGLSFGLFDTTENKAPVIFCTAYDEYALQAFKAAGIDYILKPFTAKSIAASFAKYKDLQQKLSKNNPSYKNISELFSSAKKQEQKSVLVYHKEKITPIRIEDIAVFYLQHELTHLLTFDNQHYFVSHHLEELEKMTSGLFYRANRQYLVHRNAVRDVSQYFGRKLLINLTIPFSEKITVGKVKSASFLAWLANS
ncbi:MAG: response regulator transcription factor [Chitinophagaceae bacterium]|nr:response regulator transcription factor [Chitinophagaceae bacterium]